MFLVLSYLYIFYPLCVFSSRSLYLYIFYHLYVFLFSLFTYFVLVSQDDSGTKKKKEKSSREKEGEKREKVSEKASGDSGKKEKKKKKKKELTEEEESRNELEAFLNDGGGYESLQEELLSHEISRFNTDSVVRHRDMH